MDHRPFESGYGDYLLIELAWQRSDSVSSPNPPGQVAGVGEPRAWLNSGTLH